ncbi:MAG TPA: ferric iron uptake transcriptional regulator [Candidatus Competibacteraceae bacterium]|nr:ferric iron uptake transcriptional regulator [Candidatus Competibacteraceae bacterium]
MSSKELKKAGLKVTLPRMKILDMLEERNDQHLTAEEIYKNLLNSGEEIGLATVYRVLTQFEAAGLVKRHYFEGGQSIFELNQGDHHDHIVCVKCGRIEEFFDEVIEERQRAVAAAHHFNLAEHSLILYGVCAACQQAESSAAGDNAAA